MLLTTRASGTSQTRECSAGWNGYAFRFHWKAGSKGFSCGFPPHVSITTGDPALTLTAFLGSANTRIILASFRCTPGGHNILCFGCIGPCPSPNGVYLYWSGTPPVRRFPGKQSKIRSPLITRFHRPLAKCNFLDWPVNKGLPETNRGSHASSASNFLTSSFVNISWN